MKNKPLTLFARCIDGIEDETLKEYLHEGYLIEDEEEVSYFRDGSKAIRYLLVKEEKLENHNLPV